MDNQLPIKIDLPEDFLDEEVRCGYTVKSQMKSVWAVELDLLREFDLICKKNNIEYMACGGTMLGAVRHGGFIPWDNDIDLMMTWPNYQKLCKIGENAFQDPYFFQIDYTDRGSVRGHVQIRNSRTTAIRSVEIKNKYKFNQGIFIDVFCLDHLPDNNNEKEKFFAKIKKQKKKALLMAKYTYRCTNEVRNLSHGVIRLAKDICYHTLMLFRAEERAYDNFEKAMHRYNDTNTNEMGIVSISKIGDKYCWTKEDLESPLIYMPFEFVEIPIPSNFDSILRKTYGDWKQYVIGTGNHGDLVIDTNRPYTDYVGSSEELYGKI